MARQQRLSLFSAIFQLLALAGTSIVAPVLAGYDNCSSSSPDVKNYICSSTTVFTNCADNSTYVANHFLYDSHLPIAPSYIGTTNPSTSMGDCCRACQADSTCDAFNWSANGGADHGCHLISR